MTERNPIAPDIQDNLRAAMAIELTTMPPYLYAYWSIKPVEDGGSRKGAEIAGLIMSVIIEEMLHMGLAANVLNALGGSPAITEKPYLPSYPASLLRHAKGEYGFEVYLRPLSLQAIDAFLQIEQPEAVTNKNDLITNWKTIGEFYHALELQLKEQTSDADYRPTRQLPGYDNPGPGTLVQVGSLQDALAALDLIVEQGEGLTEDRHNDGDHEFAHYWKFLEIKQNILRGNIDLKSEVYNIVPDPFKAAYNEEQLQANRAFNVAYSELLDALQTTLNRENPDVFYLSTELMNNLSHLAAVLRNTGPIPGTAYLPGPTFEYIPATDRERKESNR